jgi:hypothetical protein
MPADSPLLSVIVVTKDTARTLRPIVAALRTQTIAASIEVIVVAPDERSGVLPESDRQAFHSVRVVAAGPIRSRGRAAACGVLEAAAPIVALTENHCFPARDWAERTLDAHAGSWAGVGPAVVNANPASAISQAMHAFGYGGFPRSGAPGVVEELPLHNSSFRRDVLVTSLEDLQWLLGDERNLHRTLRARGHDLYFDPRPVKHHINESTWWLVSGLSYSSGRRYGGSRSRDWPLWRRAAYVLGTPFLTIPIARNVWSKLSPAGDVRKGPALALVIWYGALLHAVGESVSYVVGPVEEFPFVEHEEFMIRERLGRHTIADPDVSAFVARLDDAPPESPA